MQSSSSHLRSKLSLAFALAGFALSGTNLHAQAQSLLTTNQVVISRVENIDPATILISGINFDKFKGGLVVSLSGAGNTVSTIPAVYNAASKDITATLPANVARIPGTYRLMVSFGTGTAGTDVFEFTVGAVGPKGETGAKGEPGVQGERGLKGETGAPGVKGDKGDKGEKGDTGAQGVQGERGLKGDTGSQGDKGDKGDKGDTGAQGAQGIQGVKGDTGAQGVQGIQGVKGDKGDRGEQGPAGPQGETGAQGRPGISGNFPIFQTVVEARAGGIEVGQLWVQESSGQVFQMVR